MEACGTDRKQKHMALEAAINELRNAVSRFEDLSDRISGNIGPMCEVDCSKEPKKSLLDVLNESPDIIIALSSRLQDVRAKIEGYLF